MLPITVSLSRDSEDLGSLLPDWSHEILLEHRLLARQGFLESDRLAHLLSSQQAKDKRFVLVWDILADDHTIAKGKQILDSLDLRAFSAIRVADPGIAQFVKENFPQLPLQLSLETGNHNLPGILAWARVLEPEKLILSNELPLLQQAHIRREVGIPIEMAAMGRILLFYTPRQLLSPIDPWHPDSSMRSRFVTSVEDGKHFPIEENLHGTFMFYEKDLFLLPYLDQIQEAGIDSVRIDLKYYSHQPLATHLKNFLRRGQTSDLQSIKKCLAPKLTRGFFKSNRTDKQFKKLKNMRLLPKEGCDYLGKVIETRKNQYIAHMLDSTLAVGDWVTYQVPEGAFLRHQIDWIRDMDGNRVQETHKPGLWLVNHRSSISPGSLVYKEQRQD